MLYKTLNREAKNWWWFKELRKQGKASEARQKERRSILDKVELIRTCKRYGGHLYLGNASWSLNIYSHPISWSSDSTQTVNFNGYYNLDNECYLQDICEGQGIVVIDTRSEEPLRCIGAPYVRCAASLADYVGYIKKNNLRIEVKNQNKGEKNANK